MRMPFFIGLLGALLAMSNWLVHGHYALALLCFLTALVFLIQTKTS